jgi:hypothetical protein
MTPAEIARLLGTIRGFDNRIGNPDRYIVDAWHDVAQRRAWTYQAAETAVRDYYADTRRPPLIMPGDITQHIRGQRNKPPAWWQAD